MAMPSNMPPFRCRWRCSTSGPLQELGVLELEVGPAHRDGVQVFGRAEWGQDAHEVQVRGTARTCLRRLQLAGQGSCHKLGRVA